MAGTLILIGWMFSPLLLLVATIITDVADLYRK